MVSSAATAETTSAPLADFFFIAGVETSQIFDHSMATNNLSSPKLNTTIEEQGQGEEDSNNVALTGVVPQGSSEAKRGSKRFSWDKRKSISSIAALEPKTPGSNRSSVTIKPTAAENARKSGDMNDADFSAALKRFAADRDSVVAEIQFTSGQVPQPNKPVRVRPKTQRFALEDMQTSQKSGIGSVRRRLSTMNPLTRSGTSRRSSARMSKRISGYNSVIPAPQRFLPNSGVHPLKRPYEPVLLDQYPSKEMEDELKKRSPFPDYVPMFVFPNDVNVVSADERPRSTWHGFAMTTADGSKVYGITLILWMALNQDAAAELERQCEDWRRRNMTDEEREMANSLGERLAAERARLSELLAQLPQYEPDTPEREKKEEEISGVEERITMMADILRPVRHGAASKIEGLTDGETGLWVPRAYGILGRDPAMTSFWKEWLRAITVPMFQGGVLRVPPSSPRVGIWQPLEKYVVNLCAEALSPITSRTQVELSIRELRMYARREAVNEIPGSRNVDVFALFRSLDTEVVINLFEFALAESRIIFLSSHTSMLHLACAALVQLIYPLKWAGVYIPVLPARLIQALEAPCPYIIGIERRYENVDIPEDDIVLVDLDNGTIEASGAPLPLPRQQRRKLASILHLAAPHRYRFGVPVGPPKYAVEAFPFNSFSSEHPEIFDPSPSYSNLAQLANLPSNQFGSSSTKHSYSPPLFNAFLSTRKTNSQGSDRVPTNAATPSPGASPSTTNFPPIQPLGARNDSSHSLQAGLREKRSGFLESARRNSSFGFDRVTTVTGRRPSAPLHGGGHTSTTSISTLHTDVSSGSGYAPSVYAQSTLAASTIMPQMMMQPVQNTDSTQWVEGHCMKWDAYAGRVNCEVCDDKAEDGAFRCAGCHAQAHQRCLQQIPLVCPAAFSTSQVLTAFLRCFASLLYTYRKFLTPTARGESAKSGRLFSFNKDSFLRSLPHDQADYMMMLSETQAFNEFIDERETLRPDNSGVRLFDEAILSKRNRGKVSAVFGKSRVGFLEDRSEHLWRSAQATSPASRDGPKGTMSIGRMPAKLEKDLLKEPRVVQGVPRVTTKKPMRKQVPSLLGSTGRTQSEPST